jgi:IS1 transposase
LPFSRAGVKRPLHDRRPYRTTFSVIVKHIRNAGRLGRYTPPEVIGSKRSGSTGISKDEERTMCTNHVERGNLTIRTLMKRFTRLSLGFSKNIENLEAAVGMFIAYYNFYWWTRSRGSSIGLWALPAEHLPKRKRHMSRRPGVNFIQQGQLFLPGVAGKDRQKA